MDEELEFIIQMKETIEKMLRANNLLKYMNNVGKRMEINTALMLYKVLVRSIFIMEICFFSGFRDTKRKYRKGTISRYNNCTRI